MARRSADRRNRALMIAGWMATTALVGTPAEAQQTELNVAAGQATLSSPKPGVTVIQQTTEKAILNWQTFSIAAGSSVVFQQPDAGAIALNRVLGPGASLINGSLTANGQIWLINPSGILFGGGAVVNVGGLIATTSDIRDQDFLAGRYNFGIASTTPGATVVNQGSITVANGGSAVLAALGVANQGLIAATLGTIALGGGNAFTVDFQGDKLLSFAISEPVAASPTDGAGQQLPALVSNSGTLAAAGGQVLLTAAAARDVLDNVINMSGTVVATTAHEADGAIIIDAGANGTASVTGTIDASGRSAGETGGTVKILGGTADLLSGATVDASGDAGGGTVLVGGNLHGAGPTPNAASTVMAQGATIAADAITRGNGGTVVLWADGSTVFNGSISVQGGAQGGNGGFVETSGKADLAVATGSVNALAANGGVGTWLLDPANITIATTGSTNFSGDQSFTTNPGQSDVLAASAIAAAKANVTLEATDAISVEAPVTMASNGVGLTLDAGNTIAVLAGAAITTRGGSITLDANCCGYATGSGSIQIAAPLSTIGGGQSGGSVSLIAAGGTGNVTLAGNVTAGGSVTITAPTTILQSTVAINSDGGGGGGAIIVGTIAGGTNDLALISGTAAITLGAVTTSGNLSLSTSGTFTQTQPIAAAGLALEGGGTFALSNGANSIGAVAGTVGSLDLVDSASLSAGALASPGLVTGLAASGNLTLTETAPSGGLTFAQTVTAGGSLTASTVNGNITIAPGARVTANGSGDALVLGAGVNVAAGITTGGDFVNNSGAGALGTPNGNWLIYTGDLNTAGTGVGGLTPYGERYDTAANYAPGSAANYIFYRAAPTLTITAANESMIYGDALPSLAFTTSGEVNGDAQAAALAGSPGLSTTASPASNVGTYAVAIANGTIANPLNYTLSFQAGGLTITPATLTVTPNAVATIYNAAALDNAAYSETLGSYAISGFRNGDTLGTADVTLSGSMAFNGSTATVVRNAGNYLESQGTLALGSANGNYVIGFANPAANAYAIAQLPVVLGGSRVYDGTATAAAGILTVANDLDGENLTLSGAGTLTNKNVGTNGFASAAGLALGGSAAGNYTLAAIAANGSAVTITTAMLTIAPDAGQAKIYGTNDPSLLYTVSGFAGGDGATVLTGALSRSGSGTLAGEQVGSYAITAGSLSAGNNYTIALTAQTFAITPAALTVAANAQSKLYGTNDPALTYDASGFVNATVDGVTLADTAGSVLTGALSRAQFGTLAGEQVGGYAIGQGTLAANADYTLAVTGSTLAITPAALTVAANAQSKTYGASDPALTYDASGFANGIVDGVVLADTAATVLTGSLSRAAGETVTGGPYAITQGTLAANADYTIAFTGSTLAITPLAVILSGTRIYDGTADAAAGILTVSNDLDGANLTLSGSGSLTAKDVGANGFVSGAGLTLGGSAAGNYTLAGLAANGSAVTITPATLTYIADPIVAAVGNPPPALSGNVTGFVSGDTIANATSGALTFGTPATPASPPGQYPIDGSGLAATNYVFTQAPANAMGLTINVAAPPPPPLQTYAVMAAVTSRLPPPPGNDDTGGPGPGPNPPPPSPSDGTAQSLNDIAPTSGGSDASQTGPGDDTQNDSTTSVIFQSLGGGGGGGTAGGGTHGTPGGNTNRTIINGVLTQGPPPAPPGSTGGGVPPANQSLSNWGNDAYWQ